ncbi:outer membrane beta-barrel protein [Grimontia sp. NTOU-MAR1]|uniref:outer membrane beta-barrel protein n=1 Tax=Grimontia sp. NTOU-MAR1 TaxID=3111011 RepID=UPI002DB9079B|nr:outer membrane beta-barrel protein [Grimontia sp. NTOU-MAR1]WRW00578.1 outer membrane beta-barrel protein [Grimontia sp. NTOU-MAR1]
MKWGTALLFSALTSVATQAYEQDFYIAGSLAAHELADKTGQKVAVHIGAKNIADNNFFLGGELEFALLKNDNFQDTYDGYKEDYSYSANIPVGKRFPISSGSSVDVYGLAGYSSLRIYKGSDDMTADGFRWGAGVDGNFSDLMIGLRYTQGKLNGSRDGASEFDDTEKNLSLMLGYRIQL